MRAFVVACALFAIISLALGCDTSSADEAPDLQTAINAKLEVFRSVQEVLAKSNSAGRIYYRAICRPDEVKLNTFPQAIRFPSLVTSPTTNGDTLAQLREMLSGNGNVTISKGRNKLVRINVGEVPNGILRTRISSIEFTHDQRTDPDAAISAVFLTKEVSEARRQLGVEPVLRVENRLSPGPYAKGPLLPIALKGLSIDEILDVVAVTFNVTVVYGACAQPQVFDIEIYP
jgi:hypothetical protein